jgi:S1-C subfamily serine protease
MVLLIGCGIVLGRVVVRGGSHGSVTGLPQAAPGAQSTVPSGRRPGVVDINTQLGLRNLAAAGTGIVLTSNGTVLTNNHVIAGATEISVVDTDNGHTYGARIVGYARSKDLAVIQLTGARGLPTAVIGDSARMSAGSVVTAVGNAGGKGGPPTVVTGTVTAVDQSIVATDESDQNSERLQGLIQTSAPIKPGDSGGPLLDTSGKVIGIDTAATVAYKFSGGSGSQGYAIPTNAAMPIARQIENGQSSTVVHIGRTAMLGVSVSTSGQSNNGAHVVEIIPGTPADDAGIQVGSVVTSLDGSPVGSADDLTGLLLRYHPGDTVRLGWTDPSGVQRTTQIRLANGPAQ